MRKYIVCIILLAVSWSVDAQKKAVTETGEEVLLFDDNTWKYVNDASDTDVEAKPIPVNGTPYVKAKNAGFLLKSTKAGMGVWIDAKKWQFKKATTNEEAEFNGLVTLE